MAEWGDPVLSLAERFGTVARVLAGSADVTATLHKIMRLGVETLDACEFAGTSIVEHRRIAASVSTDDVPRLLDDLQSGVDEGPCLDAIRDHPVIITQDLTAEARWPQFSARAHDETGVRSVLSLRLYVDDDIMGSLNLYSTQVDAFDETDVALASVFAAHAAVALAASRREQNLQRMADSREIIGRAKGQLMARSHITDEQAFDLLRKASQRMNVKLVDVATDIAEGRDLR